MKKVEDLLQLEGGKYSIKLWNVFFKNNGQVFCDAYLAEIDGNWTIMLNGNGNKILLSKAQIEYLISKMERLDLLKEVREELEFEFGLTNGSGINRNGQYYKLLFQYQSHYNGEKKSYPLTMFIKEFKHRYSVDFEKMLLDLYKFKDILEKMLIGRGTVKVESIYDIDQQAMIYKRESYSNLNSNQSSSSNDNQSRSQSQSSNNSHSCEDCNKSIPDYVADFSQRHFEKDLCRKCQDNYR